MKTDSEHYTLPIEHGFRFLLLDDMKTILIILSIVLINFMLVGLYVLFSKFNFISYLVFLGLVGIGIYFMIKKLNFVSKHSKSEKSLSEERESDNEKSKDTGAETTLRKVKHLQNLLKKEGLSNKTVLDEDLKAFEDVPAFIRRQVILDFQKGEEELKSTKFTFSHKKFEAIAKTEFEDRVKIIMFELFKELTKEIQSLELRKADSMEPKVIKEIEENADRDITKLRELLTILYEILGDDFFIDKQEDNPYEQLLDLDYLQSIKGKFKTSVLHNPTH